MQVASELIGLVLQLTDELKHLETRMTALEELVAKREELYQKAWLVEKKMQDERPRKAPRNRGKAPEDG